MVILHHHRYHKSHVYPEQLSQFTSLYRIQPPTSLSPSHLPNILNTKNAKSIKYRGTMANR